MFGLTPLGLVHTAISLVARWTGLHSLLRGGAIDPRSGPGRIYLRATVLTCLTSFGIFRHGGFNEAHGLGMLLQLLHLRRRSRAPMRAAA